MLAALRARLAAPRQDRPAQRPGDLAYAAEDVPPLAQALPLALQQLATQAIYFLLPVLVAEQFGMTPDGAAGYLALSMVAVALAGLLQIRARGPVGSGYAIASIPSPVFAATFMLVAESGNPAVAAAMTMAVGLLGLLPVALLRRLHALMPTEVAGVVVFLIGVSLLPRAFGAVLPAGLDANLRQPAPWLALGALGVMLLAALLRHRLSRFGLLLGTALGCAAAVPLGLVPEQARALVAGAAWFALPLPQPPPLAAFDPALLPAFVLALLASFASWTGDLVAFQRAADGDWKRPDPEPIRRGLAAQCLGLVLGGFWGGMAPGSSSACVGLAIGTRTLSRRVVALGSTLLLALACCPKLVALVVAVPGPVQAAMLGYVCCFMMASGCQLMTARMLDARRTFTIGFGLAVGLGVLIQPALFDSWLPAALNGPVTAGTLVALLLNLATAPLVARAARFELKLVAGLHQQVVDRCTALGGAWALRAETALDAQHCLLEVAELLAERGAPAMLVQARHADELLVLLLHYAGPPLPPPSRHPQAEDLEGPAEAREGFALWLATRRAHAVSQRHGNGRGELRVEFSD